MRTALAPRARALTTSVPRRMPPSTRTGMRPSMRSTTRGRAWMVAGTVSRFRAPWFETMMPAAPASSPRAASSAFRTPFKRTGTFAKDRSHSTSFQVSDGSRSAGAGAPGRRTFSSTIPGGTANPARAMRSRAPMLGVSTVRHSAWQPAASTRRTSSRVKPRSGCTYSWNQSGLRVAAATSSTAVVENELTTKVAPAAEAPRAVATSPSGWNSRWYPVGASRIGYGSSRPRMVTRVSRRETSTRTRGSSRIRSYASRFARNVTSSAAPPATNA